MPSRVWPFARQGEWWFHLEEEKAQENREGEEEEEEEAEQAGEEEDDEDDEDEDEDDDNDEDDEDEDEDKGQTLVFHITSPLLELQQLSALPCPGDIVGHAQTAAPQPQYPE